MHVMTRRAICPGNKYNTAQHAWQVCLQENILPKSTWQYRQVSSNSHSMWSCSTMVHSTPCPARQHNILQCSARDSDNLAPLPTPYDTPFTCTTTRFSNTIHPWAVQLLMLASPHIVTFDFSQGTSSRCCGWGRAGSSDSAKTSLGQLYKCSGLTLSSRSLSMN